MWNGKGSKAWKVDQTVFDYAANGPDRGAISIPILREYERTKPLLQVPDVAKPARVVSPRPQNVPVLQASQPSTQHEQSRESIHQRDRERQTQAAQLKRAAEAEREQLRQNAAATKRDAGPATAPKPAAADVATKPKPATADVATKPKPATADVATKPNLATTKAAEPRAKPTEDAAPQPKPPISEPQPELAAREDAAAEQKQAGKKKRQAAAQPSQVEDGGAQVVAVPSAASPQDSLQLIAACLKSNGLEVDQNRVVVDRSSVPLGQGATAHVWKCTFDGVPAAVKIPKLSTSEVRKALASELKALNRLRHPCCVLLLGVCNAGKSATGEIMIVMELCEGGSVEDWIKSSSVPPAPQVAVQIMIALFSALAYLEKQGILHRDVKSANLLLDAARQRAKLADFGLAQTNSTILSATMQSGLGTASYMAPETFGLSGTYSPASDVFAAIVTANEICSWAIAFTQPKRIELMQIITGVSQGERPTVAHKPGIPAAITALMPVKPAGGGWAQDPAARPSAAAILKTLLSLPPAIRRKYRAFVSYCWLNSLGAQKRNQLGGKAAIGTADPREIATVLKAAGLECFLDAEVLKDGQHLPKQLMEALEDSDCVVLCMSPEYGASMMCECEAIYAIRTLQKPIVPVVVGNDFAATKKTAPWFMLCEPLAIVATGGLSKDVKERIVSRVREFSC
eukprot:TRINITY_DN1404_c0_g1_i1.p1 TRINITY_DN1404_c0_g1~~TRINITY_DN1404_c0_g1_i1.p1  ORF type:complete len:686 (-),score=146.42 TRINITY_DN1404_c0_g1_i1:8-2065(-)